MLTIEVIRPMNNPAWDKHHITGKHLINLIVNKVIAVSAHHIVKFVKIVVMMRVHNVTVICGYVDSESGILRENKIWHKNHLFRESSFGQIRPFLYIIA